MTSFRLLGRPVRSQLLLLAIVEFFILLGSIYAGASIRFSADIASAESGVGWLLPRAVSFATIMIMCMFAMGLYQARLRIGIIGFISRLVSSYFLCGAMLAVIFYVVHDLYFGRGVLAISVGVSAVGIVMARLVLLSPFVEKALKTQILVVGTGEKANNILHLPLRMDLTSCHIVGFMKVDDEVQVIDAANTLKLDRALADYATENEIDEIVVAVEDRRKNLPIQDLMECRMRGIPVIDEITFFERESGKVRLDMLKPSWIIFSDGFQVNAARQNSKRLFDIVSSILLLTVTWPIMLLTALAILIESNGKGPIFYQQSRVGQGGKPFLLLKFRSMRVDAEACGTPQWAQRNDTRVTLVGKIIRRFRIDELPQILNILSGKMSFIGPRPERPEFVSQLSEQINYYRERHRIKPGLSGWAQLCYPYGGSTEDSIEKLQYDLYYVKNHNLFMDLSILIQTVEVVFFGKGVR